SYQPIPKLGTNTVASSTVFLDGVRVPADRVIGAVDQGFAVLWDILNPERILAAAGGVGSGGLVLKIACEYAAERAPFGRPIGSHQGIAFPLARIKAQLELARLMTYNAAWLWDRGRPCGSEANIAKLTAADEAWQAADRAFQTFGGMAYSMEYPVARMFRDARIAKNIPVAEELVLAHIAQHELGLPKSYRPVATDAGRPDPGRAAPGPCPPRGARASRRSGGTPGADPERGRASGDARRALLADRRDALPHVRAGEPEERHRQRRVERRPREAQPVVQRVLGERERLRR